MDDNDGGRSGEVDWLSNLPESLISQILLNLPTKDVVKSSVLSSKWRNLWRFVPGLDLEYPDFPEYEAFVSFADMFLGFNSESCIQNFTLKLDWNDYEDERPDIDDVTRWINFVIERKVQNLHVSYLLWVSKEMEIPPTIYTCDSLVSLKLDSVNLASPEFVSLPSVKVIDLRAVKFANELDFEKLISGCPVLESLTLTRNVEVSRVCSQSLLRFTYASQFGDFIDRVVTIDAPRLEYLKLSDSETNFMINNSSSLVKVNIDMKFNMYFKRFHRGHPYKRNMFRNFLFGISGVKDVRISLDTVKEIYDFSIFESLPLFRNLSYLDVDCNEFTWKMLLVFLQSCPNLKSLVMGCTIYGGKVVGIMPAPQCFLSSLEFVKIVEKTMWKDAKEMKLVSYFLENSAMLKKLTLCLDDSRKKEASVILKKLLTIPRLSTSCQVVVF